jgi:hypothetical protein
MNVFTYAKLAEPEGDGKAEIYEKIAERWLKHANWWRKTHLRNCRLVRVYFILDIICFIVFMLELNQHQYWRVLLILVWVAFILNSIKHYGTKRGDKPDQL